MAKFAPVAPIQILETMREKGMHLLGDYHLLLTHHVLEHPERFRALFDNTENEAIPQCTIIMDNSVVELGDAVSDAKVLEACKVIPDKHWVYPVCIDVMADGPATREASTESFHWWRENAPSYSPMIVLQGNSWEEFVKSADYFLLDLQFGALSNVGIPRILVDHLNTRWRAIKYVEALRPDINVHLLGFSNDVTDDVICANHPSVAGIDSAVPVRYPVHAPDALYTPGASIPKRPEDWFENGEYTDQVGKNVLAMRKWVA